MGATRIPKQYSDTAIDLKSLISSYNTSVAGREIREGIAFFIRTEGFDKLKTFLTAVIAAIPTLNPLKMDSSGTLSMQTPQVGVDVTVVPSHWDGIPKPALTFQWKKDGTNISGATSATYTPVSGDATHTLSCLVTATNSGGSATETISAANATAAAS